MREKSLDKLRTEIRAWERETFGTAVAGGETGGMRAPPGNWPRFDIPHWDSAMEMWAAVSPDCSFRLLRDAIATARKTLDVYIYNIQSDHIVELLRTARPDVKLRIMYDVTDHNAAKSEMAELATVKKATKKEAPSAAPRRVFTVCHQKFVVIDKTSVVLGSANWAETSIPFLPKPGTFKKGNREWLVHAKSAPVAAWFTALFEADWNLPATRELPQPLALTRPAPVKVPAKAANPPPPVDVLVVPKGDKIQVTPIISPQNYFEDVGALIRGAKKSIFIQQQYILAGGAKVEGLIQAVQQQAKKLDVRIMVSPTFPKNWDRSVQTLTHFGLESKLKALNLDHYIHLHNKGLIIDGKHVVVSSTNWSQNSIDSAREAGLIITAPKIADFFSAAFKTDWERGWLPNEVSTRKSRVFETVSRSEPGAWVEVPAGDLVA